jgi:hypothetical protein
MQIALPVTASLATNARLVFSILTVHIANHPTYGMTVNTLHDSVWDAVRAQASINTPFAHIVKRQAILRKPISNRMNELCVGVALKHFENKVREFLKTPWPRSGSPFRPKW